MKTQQRLTRLFTSRGRVDRRLWLDIGATRQEIRLVGRKATTPPLLIVQGGPGLPLLNEVPRFGPLDLESDFTVCYWDQRGCGRAAASDVKDLSVATQIEDLRHIVALLYEGSGQKVHVLGISMGATYSLIAAQSVGELIASLTVVSPDINIRIGDIAAAEHMQQAIERRGDKALGKRLAKLGPPPYLTSGQFQARAQILTDLGFIEYGKRFSDSAMTLLLSLLRTYGLGGALRAIGNLSRVADRLIPPTNDINLIGKLDWLKVPVHFVFGDHDPFLSDEAMAYVGTLTASGMHRVSVLKNAAHFLQFDTPAELGAIVRAMARP